MQFAAREMYWWRNRAGAMIITGRYLKATTILISRNLAGCRFSLGTAEPKIERNSSHLSSVQRWH
jgi:hypothetical protein